jgi:hypothetical protein
MKSLVSLIALIVTLTCTAMAQDTARPALSLSNHGDAAANTEDFSWGPPPPRPNILFYGGDINTDDPNADAFANGNTLLVGNSPTYGALRVPKTGHFMITGIFFSTIATGTGNIFDPPTATYDIRVDMNPYGGTSVASGSGVQTAQPTGRMPFGYPEYLTSVALTKPFTPTNGETYWVNESPQCTDSGNSNCENEQFFVDNTTQQTGAVNGKAQPKGESFFDCNYCSGLTFYNWCLSGVNEQQCAYLSFGIYGRGRE